MRIKNVHLGVLIIGFMLSFVSCATQSRLLSSWELPGADVGPFHKIVVFALMGDHERSKAVEMAAVNQLEKTGVQAVPGFTVLADTVKLDLKKMESQVNATGADAVLIYKVIAVNRDLSYVPPTAFVTGAAPYGYWWDDPYWGYYTPYPYNYWGYWYPGYQVTMSPGYWVTSDTYRVETVIYRTSDNHLVWSAVSETFDPENRSDLGASLTRRIVQRLERQGIIKKS